MRPPPISCASARMPQPLMVRLMLSSEKLSASICISARMASRRSVTVAAAGLRANSASLRRRPSSSAVPASASRSVRASSAAVPSSSAAAANSSLSLAVPLRRS